METNISRYNAEQLNDDLRKVLIPVSVYVGVEAVLGFFGNLLVLYVFKFQYQKCIFRYFVLCIAMTDTIASLTTISGEIVTQMFWYIYPIPIICKLTSFFNVFTVFAESFSLLTIAVDRYLKVCNPLGWQITPRIALYLCSAIYFISSVIAIPLAIYWGVHNRQVNRTVIDENGSGYMTVNVTICEIDQKYVNSQEPKDYTNFLMTIISFSLIPMFILYVLVAKTLICSSSIKKRQQREIKLSTSKNKVCRAETRNNDNRTDDEPEHISSISQASDCANANSSMPPNRQSIKLEHISVDEITDDSLCTTQTETSFSETSISRPSKSPDPNKSVRKNRRGLSSRVRRNTLIMFILTFVFIVTTITYLAMLGRIAGDILETLSNSDKALYFFFFRLYFLNHVINPVVYGFLDPQFRKVTKSLYRKLSRVCFRSTQ